MSKLMSKTCHPLIMLDFYMPHTREVGGSSPPVSTITKARKSLIIQWFSGLFYTFAHTAQRQNFALRCALFYYFDVKIVVKKISPHI